MQHSADELSTIQSVKSTFDRGRSADTDAASIGRSFKRMIYAPAKDLARQVAQDSGQCCVDGVAPLERGRRADQQHKQRDRTGVGGGGALNRADRIDRGS